MQASSSTTACTVGKSFFEIDSQARKPTPCSANTVSMTIEPPSMKPSCTAAIDTTGIAALRAACLSTIERRDRPLARAVRM